MQKVLPIHYTDAGVSIKQANRATAKIKRLVRGTFNSNVLAGIGSFGASYALPADIKRPVLISSADGVGTKLKVAFAMNAHNTVGQDLVNHCVNDIAVQGAKPLFFLDYFATGKLESRTISAVIKGLSLSCRKNGCTLIGGETAEMPDMYAAGEYDLAGFIVGVAERHRVIDGTKIGEGDVLIGLPSNGLHTNGYSLARKLFFEVAGFKPQTKIAALRTTIGKELLRVHRSYLNVLQTLGEARLLRGAAHITGGGITENTPRMLPKGLCAQIKSDAWPRLPVFQLLQEVGNVDTAEMLKVFNMGLGMIVAVSKRNLKRAEVLLARMNEPAYVIGSIEKGHRRVYYK